MNLWNVKALREDLRAGHLSSETRMKYLLVNAVLTFISVYLTKWQGEPFDPLQGFEAVSILGVASFGTWSAWKMNQRGDDKDLIERFICLGVPIGLQVSVYCMVFMYGLSFITAPYAIEAQKWLGSTGVEWVGRFMSSSINVAFQVWYFAWITKELGLVSGGIFFRKPRVGQD